MHHVKPVTRDRAHRLRRGAGGEHNDALRGAQKILATNAASDATCGLSRFSLHSKRVFSLCSARRTRALLRLKADLLGKHPSKWDSRSSALGARQARTQTSKLHTENNIRFACLASGTKNIPCLASGTKNIPFQKRSRARISSYEAARAQRTLLENFYRGTRLDACMRLTRCAHTCIYTYLKIDFLFFRSQSDILF